jgi:hypothetical protein
MVSSSAQIADNISGSLSQVHLSSKISGIVSASSIASSAQGQVALTTNGVAATAVDLGLQTGDSPTFAGGTITGDFAVGGTLTAQEVHTEFESASILFTSGSTKFGDTIDDTHEVTGSMTMSGSVTINDGNFIVTDKVGFGTNNPSNVLHLEFNDDSDVFTAARITDNSVSGILINNLDTGNGHGGMLKFANKNGDNHTAIAHSQDGNTDASLLFFSMDGGTLAEVMRVDHTHAIGIGNSAPAASLHIGSSDGTQYSSTAEPRESMIIQNPSGSDDNGVGLHSTLGFQVADGATSQGFINYVRTGNNTGEFTFSQRTASSTYAEHMRIDSSGFVGIGTNNPGAILDVDSGATGESDSEACGIRVTLQRNGSAQGLTLRHEDASGGSTDASEGTSIQFQGYDGSNSYHNLAAIFGRADGESVSDSDSPGFLTFHTTPDGSDSFSERMRITSAGNVGIGTDNPATQVHIFDGSAQTELRVESNNDDAKLTLDATTNKDPQISMQANGSEKWKIRNKTDNTNTFEILNGDGDGIKIEDDGDLDVRTGDILFSTSGKGICLGVTSNTDSNTLDDYEEGSYTPVSVTDSLTFTSAVGRYTKIGRLCFVRIAVTYPTTTGSHLATPRISLPFTALSDGVNPIANVFPPSDDSATNAANGFIGRPNGNQAFVELIRKKEGSDADNSDMTNTSVAVTLWFTTTT